ncbi:hypothetical protein [Psychromonas aquimarina]|uniref:hypothetical protein n=1 Tax=Psychromonas aquimarina TaxID=444919 RepID=UPI0004919D5F|nr:hypothetical protein [Psychromonas aquimarina]
MFFYIGMFLYFFIPFFAYGNWYVEGNNVSVMSNKYGTLIYTYYKTEGSALDADEPYYLDSPSYISTSHWEVWYTKGSHVQLRSRDTGMCIERAQEKNKPIIQNPCKSEYKGQYLERIATDNGSFLLRFQDTQYCVITLWGGAHYFPYMDTCPPLNQEVDSKFLWSFIPIFGDAYVPSK